jgi:Uncharacterized conserved protein
MFIKSTSKECNKLFPFDQLTKIQSDNLTIYKTSIGNRSLEVLIGDLKDNQPKISTYLKNIHAIYQDPFSPKKNPTLWSKDWFETLKNISSSDVILSTYSASHSVHQNLEAAGWNVYRAPGFAHKRSSTRATLKEGVYSGPIK